MDQWTEKELKYMGLGGNKIYFDFFQQYDLNEEQVQMKYKSKAAEYYRLKVRALSIISLTGLLQLASMVEDNIFYQSKPPYEEGRD